LVATNRCRGRPALGSDINSADPTNLRPGSASSGLAIPDRFENCDGEPDAVGHAAAVRIVALVGVVGEELVHRVSVGGVHLDTVT
jgi:hypothetical protein